MKPPINWEDKNYMGCEYFMKLITINSRLPKKAYDKIRKKNKPYETAKFFVELIKQSINTGEIYNVTVKDLKKYKYPAKEHEKRLSSNVEQKTYGIILSKVNQLKRDAHNDPRHINITKLTSYLITTQLGLDDDNNPHIVTLDALFQNNEHVRVQNDIRELIEQEQEQEMLSECPAQVITEALQYKSDESLIQQVDQIHLYRWEKIFNFLIRKMNYITRKNHRGHLQHTAYKKLITDYPENINLHEKILYNRLFSALQMYMYAVDENVPVEIDTRNILYYPREQRGDMTYEE